MNNDNKNFVLFAVLAALILFGWPVISGHFFPTANPPVTKVVDGKSTPLPQPHAAPAATTPEAVRDRAVVLGESPRVRINTPSLQGSINLKGARIDDLTLIRYEETVAKNSPPIRLLSPSGAADAYFAGFSWGDNGLKPPAGDTVWRATGTELAPGKPVTLDASNAQGQRFRIELSVDDRYMFTIKQTVANAGGGAVPVAAYGYVSRVGHSKDPDSWTMHTGPIAATANGANYDIDFQNLEGNEPGFLSRTFGNKTKAGINSVTSTGGWVGFTDKYWLAAIVPDQGATVDLTLRPRERKDAYQADFVTQPKIVQPGQAITSTSRFFAGAKEVATLQHYEVQGGIKFFDKAIDWGWFEIVEKPIFKVLHWLFTMVGNFGVAIILLTFIVRGLMFPIAQRQFASMAQMRAIQPKMKAIQERYKDDKARQQQEIMAMYRAEKVNPLAGCLPTLLQIPVFYALYKVLMLTIEMRHQPFALWIKDLSAPDPLHILNLFGYLDFNPPAFLAIGVFPVLLGLSMYFQFKLNPAPMDDVQKQVFAIMPWMLMFVMAPFAVGLQVYWITSNLLTIAQQKWLYSRHPALKEAPVK